MTPIVYFDAMDNWYPVEHRKFARHGNAKGRRLLCDGVAFWRPGPGPVPPAEIPRFCQTCGDDLVVGDLNFASVVDLPAVVHRDGPPPPPRPPRHYGPVTVENRTTQRHDILNISPACAGSTFGFPSGK